MGGRLKYGYANARSKALKTELLDKAILEEMLKAEKAGDVLGVLERTLYGQEMSSFYPDFRGADLAEVVIGKNFAQAARKVINITPTDKKETIITILEKWDLHNLKTIMLAKFLGQEKIAPFIVAAGSLNEADLAVLMEKRDVDGVLSALEGTRYGNAVSGGLDEYRQKKQLQPIFNAMDSWHYGNLVKKIKIEFEDERHLLNYFRETIDAKNIINIMRSKIAEISGISQYMIPGGNIRAEGLEELIGAKDVEQIVGKVKWLFELGEALEKFRKDNSLSHFEEEMERITTEKAIRKMRTSVLSLSSVFSFLLMKEEEMKNIRKIIRGKEYNLTEEEIRKMLQVTE
ncbi:MAG: V-type ATPase subunit [Candidatus Diapherotrites archaeon]